MSLEIINLSYNLDNFKLPQISQVFTKDQPTLLVGPSGCGKSTFGKLLVGMVKPTAGEIRLDGESLSRQPTKDRILVFQGNDLFPWWTVEQQLTRLDQKVSSIDAKEWLEWAQLEKEAQKFPYELSFGMQKRLSLARALALQPQVLVLDETFSAIDKKLRQILIEKTSDLAMKKEMILIVVSHHKEDFDTKKFKILELF